MLQEAERRARTSSDMAARESSYSAFALTTASSTCVIETDAPRLEMPAVEPGESPELSYLSPLSLDHSWTHLHHVQL